MSMLPLSLGPLVSPAPATGGETPVDQAQANQQKLDTLFGSEFLGGLTNYLSGGGAQGLAGIGLLLEAYDRLGDIGQQGLTLGQELARS